MTWSEAVKKLHEVTAGRRYTMGSGYDYPLPFAAFYLDAISGEGTGFRVCTTKDGRLESLVAVIEVIQGESPRK